MKSLLLLLWMFHLVTAQPDVDRETYCESCLLAAKAIERAVTEAPEESRQRVIEGLTVGGVCDGLMFDSGRHSHQSIRSSCAHLLDNHQQQLGKALGVKGSKRLDVLLCYELSSACVGVRRESFKSSTMMDSDIDALLRDNQDNLRMSRPVHSKDEL